MAADRPELSAKKRKVLGRKVKSLRREGILPANLYGKKVKSQALELPLSQFQKIFDKAGETGLVDLKTNGESSPVLISNVQFDPVSSLPIHTDFHQVSLTEKTTADIPIELVGEAPAVTQKIGILIQPLSEVEVEALPADLPDRLEVNISNLKEIDDAVTVGDLIVNAKKVKVLVDKSEIVAMITPLVKEEVVAPPPPVEGEAVAPAAEGEEVPAAAEAPAEGEAKAPPTEAGKPEEKPAEGTRPARPKPSRGESVKGKFEKGKKE